MKMKTFRKFALALTVISCCSMVNVSAYSDAKASRAKSEFDPTYAIVNDFEKIADLYELSWSNNFGSATLNTDMEYVTNGTASMKLNPVGRFKPTDANPKIMIPLNRHKEHAASKMTSVEFDVFNASGNDATINCALAIDGTNTKYLDFQVKNGEQKTIKIEYDLVAMSAAYDINNVEGIYVQFPKTLDRENYKDNVFYVDKFVAYYTPFESKGYEMSFADGEFCSFDEIYHEYMVNTNCGTGAIEGYRPELSINTDSYYCADKDSENFVYGKNKSLKLVAKGGGTEGNPGFTFSDKVWHNFEWSEMNDKALTFDVYNASESAFSFSLVIFRNPDNYQTGYYDRYSKSFTVPAYSWVTVSLPIKEMNESTKNTNGNPMTSYIQYGKVVYTYGIPFFIYSSAAVGNQDRTFYFDNFRITDVEA